MALGHRDSARRLRVAASNAEIYVYVVSSYVHYRDSEARTDHDTLMFKCSPAGLQLMLYKLPVGALRGAETAASFASLAERLRQIDDYYWVGMYVGAHVRKGDVDVIHLHSRVLSHFDAWLR